MSSAVIFVLGLHRSSMWSNNLGVVLSVPTLVTPPLFL